MKQRHILGAAGAGLFYILSSYVPHVDTRQVVAITSVRPVTPPVQFISEADALVYEQSGWKLQRANIMGDLAPEEFYRIQMDVTQEQQTQNYTFLMIKSVDGKPAISSQPSQ